MDVNFETIAEKAKQAGYILVFTTGVCSGLYAYSQTKADSEDLQRLEQKVNSNYNYHDRKTDQIILDWINGDIRRIERKPEVMRDSIERSDLIFYKNQKETLKIEMNRKLKR